MSSTLELDPTPATAPAARRGRWIDDWRPEDPEFWQRTGRRVAHRNLFFSVLAEHLGFNVWILWSMVVVSLNPAGFDFSADQLFWLISLPNLVGSALRIPYTFAVPRFGGRAWTTISASLLLIPCLLLIVAVQDTSTPYWFFLLAAATAGLGGGNFSSSMANISFFFPEGKKGFALGLNAAGGNIGVAVTQLLVPLVISIGGGVHLAYAGMMWMPFVILAGVCAWFFMDSLTVAKTDRRSYVTALSNKHTWVMSFLYIGTFGSFIGYSFALPLLIKSNFPELVNIPLLVKLGFLAFAGALIGSVTRPLGGWLSDRLGGGRVTLLTFAGMAIGAVGVLVGLDTHSFPVFLGSFLWLFVMSGVGNGSTYRMIPAIFGAQARARALEEGRDPDSVVPVAKRHSAAVIGIAGAIGAFGGFLINQVFRISHVNLGTIAPALWAFLAVYLVSIGVTWWFYLRRRVLVARVPSLAHAQV
ncbi:MFS transporter [Longimycelium tulufanense]|uniref:MFS transporter n=1 Tax=Longimycelium tulufanense TaxID=907463 RepID=A0A8J3C6N8_9PSEU|nr:nitrate/nitrite transporter [Longimycelium tulufanense]GGM42291.1 MFS transporter [Longimycelium tulufanense]